MKKLLTQLITLMCITMLSACNSGGGSGDNGSSGIKKFDSLITYIKASNTDAGDYFGTSLAISANGTTLAVGATNEDSTATGIDGDQNDNSEDNAGAVYVYTRSDEGKWAQDAYIKASNTDAGNWFEGDAFGASVAISADGTTLAVGATGEDSNATGIHGDQNDNSADNAGAVYVYTRSDSGDWTQGAYIKASNTDANDLFGVSLAISADGTMLAVGADEEDSNATGIDGNQSDNSVDYAGAVYVYTRSDSGTWRQQAYIKASNTDAFDEFGGSLAISADGTMLAVGADEEDSNATGIDGNQSDNSVDYAGAVYVYTRSDSGTWRQQAYIKASNTEASDLFGGSLAISANGTTLAVGAFGEDSTATGIDGDQSDNSANSGSSQWLGAVGAGAVYVYTRSD